MRRLNTTKLKLLRQQRSWEQQQLAAVAQVNASVISRLEAGAQRDFKLSVVTSIADALGVTVDSLLEDTEKILKSDLTPELEAVVSQLGAQPERIQSQLATIIQCLLSTLGEHE